MGTLFYHPNSRLPCPNFNLVRLVCLGIIRQVQTIMQSQLKWENCWIPITDSVNGHSWGHIKRSNSNHQNHGLNVLWTETQKKYSALMSEFPVEIRMNNFTFSVPHTAASTKIKTVYNSSFVYDAVKLFKRFRTGSLGLFVLHKVRIEPARASHKKIIRMTNTRLII